MGRIITFLFVVSLVSGCASLDVPIIGDLSTCDLPDTAICNWERQAEEGANDLIDYADNRVCIDIVTQCPAESGELVAIDCPRQDCQSEPGVGDRVRSVVPVRPQ